MSLAEVVVQVAKAYDCGSVLDYGCGSAPLAQAIRDESTLSVREYDAAVPGKNTRPSFADLVVCAAVLEHVAPLRMDAVLAQLRGLARKAVILVIATSPEPAAWWQARVEAAGFTMQPDLLPALGHAWVAWVTP